MHRVTLSRLLAAKCNETVALNVVLVLEGVRLCYRCEYPELVSRILEIVPDMMSYPLIPSEPILFLKTNAKIILDKFNRSIQEDPVHGGHIGFGRVLGYVYVGPNWIGSENHFTVCYMVGEAICLYSFNVPKGEYTQYIRDIILASLDKLDTCLSEYGYRVSLEFVYRTSNKLEQSSETPQITL